MSDDKAPQKFRMDIVIGMNYAVACINYCSGVWYCKFRINFADTIESLSHNFDLSFYNTFSHYIMFKQIVSIRKINKTAL